MKCELKHVTSTWKHLTSAVDLFLHSPLQHQRCCSSRLSTDPSSCRYVHKTRSRALGSCHELLTLPMLYIYYTVTGEQTRPAWFKATQIVDDFVAEVGCHNFVFSPDLSSC